MLVLSKKTGRVRFSGFIVALRPVHAQQAAPEACSVFATRHGPSSKGESLLSVPYPINLSKMHCYVSTWQGPDSSSLNIHPSV